MKVMDRFVVLSIFVDLMWWPFCLGFCLTANMPGAWLLAARILFWAPLLAFPMLIVGYNLKKPVLHKAVCGAALGLMLLSVGTVAASWNFVHHGLVQPYADLQMADVTSVRMYYNGPELEPADAERVVDLFQQLTYYNPGSWVEDYAHQITPEADYPMQFSVRRENGHGILLAAWPPYYVDNAIEAYTAADEDICRQIADLYWELKDKYYPKNEQLAAE